MAEPFFVPERASNKHRTPAKLSISARKNGSASAAALVEDGDIIVLDTGTTTLHIARNIRDRQNVTVVTNDYQIARELEASPSIQTILLGDR
nr:DNA-binding transcriptional regulator AgaR [Klebsiella pneumoniae]